jgi:hypothetical protein
MKKIIPLILVVFFLVTLTALNVNAATFKLGDCIDITTTCANCTYSNITSIEYPNGTGIILEKAMTENGIRYSYNTCNRTNLTGEYIVFGHYDLNGIDVVWDNTYNITLNGNERPEGIVKVLFFAFFLFILFWAILSFLKVLGHWKDLEVDIIEVATVLGLYFVIFAYQYLAINYLGDKLINDIMELMVVVGAITHVFIPLVAFAASLILNPFRRGTK